MEQSTRPGGREEQYGLMLRQMQALLEGERRLIPNLANAAALLWEGLDRINWAGFYLMDGDGLLLGPFQGKPACIHIAVGKGVCGTAVLKNKTQLVADVHRFPGHIACDSDSNSELVVPLRQDGRVVGVLDVDSPFPDQFDTVDAGWLEKIARVIEEGCDF